MIGLPLLLMAAVRSGFGLAVPTVLMQERQAEIVVVSAAVTAAIFLLLTLGLWLRDSVAGLLALLTLAASFAFGVLTPTITEHVYPFLGYLSLSAGTLTMMLCLATVYRRLCLTRNSLWVLLLASGLGAALLAEAGTLLTWGDLLRYRAGWGGLKLRDYGGGDLTWDSYLAAFLVGRSFLGAALGATCGFAMGLFRVTQVRFLLGNSH